MSVYDKRVTRDMRMMMLKIHNDLKDIKNTVEECNDMWLSDLRKMEEIIHTLHMEFESFEEEDFFADIHVPKKRDEE